MTDVAPGALVPVVVYGAKSTDDVRGSIATQLQDCRDAVAALGGRRIVGEFTDEAFSAFKRSRGPGLERALICSAQAVVRFGSAELWVQHSDRLARGDGKSARHLVEIALWGMKAGVAVRPVEDGDTFRDLLYAVVTGERNHHDSRRKGVASAAGLKRGAHRGDYTGSVVDGYRVVVTADERGRVSKRLEIDPGREPLMRLIFRLALQGVVPAEIARRVNSAGWKTVPRRRDYGVRTFSPTRIRQVLVNPRYAGLAIYHGEIVGPGHWPAYVTDRQWKRLQRQREARAGTWTRHDDRPRAAFLLRHLLRCGFCGSWMYAITNRPRTDGTRSRRYGCEGFRQKRCTMRWVDAEIVDSVFVANLHAFLGFPGRQQHVVTATERGSSRAFDETLVLGDQLKRAIGEAFARGDSSRAERLVDELVAHREWIVLNQRHAPSFGDEQHTAHELLFDFYRWAAAERSGRAEDSTQCADRLNGVLRAWFDRVEITHTGDEISMLPMLRDLPAEDFGVTAERHPPHKPIALRTLKGQWAVGLRRAGVPHRAGEPWKRDEIVYALAAWAREQGRTPKYSDWSIATGAHPNHSTVLHHFGHWADALAVANLPPSEDLRRTSSVRDSSGRWLAHPGPLS